MAFTNDGKQSLVVSTGTTPLAEGAEYNYLTVWVKSGATLSINGTGVTTGKPTVISARREFIVDGTIKTTNGQLSTTTNYRGVDYASTRTQAAAGTGTGTAGANGAHGGNLLIYANNLSGSGTIDASGSAGSKGADAAVSSYNCSSAPNSSWTVTPVCSKQTCFYTTCSCSPTCTNVVKKDQESLPDKILNIFSINSAYAGYTCSCPEYTQYTPTVVYDGKAGGGGAGGNGGRVWIATKYPYTQTITVNTSAGAGGAAGSNGTATVGSSGTAGSVSYSTFR